MHDSKPRLACIRTCAGYLDFGFWILMVVIGLNMNRAYAQNKKPAKQPESNECIVSNTYLQSANGKEYKLS